MRDHLYPILIIAAVVLGVFAGLYFTKLSWLSTYVVPAALGVVLTSLFGLIALPLFPWLILGLTGLFIALFLYEWKVNKTFAGAVKGTENALGVCKSGSAPASSTGPIQVQLNHA